MVIRVAGDVVEVQNCNDSEEGRIREEQGKMDRPKFPMRPAVPGPTIMDQEGD